MSYKLNRMASSIKKMEKFLPTSFHSFGYTFIFNNMVKLAGTAGLRVEKLNKREVEVTLRNKRKVQNHIGGAALELQRHLEVERRINKGKKIDEDKQIDEKEISKKGDGDNDDDKVGGEGCNNNKRRKVEDDNSEKEKEKEKDKDSKSSSLDSKISESEVVDKKNKVEEQLSSKDDSSKIDHMDIDHHDNDGDEVKNSSRENDMKSCKDQNKNNIEDKNNNKDSSLGITKEDKEKKNEKKTENPINLKSEEDREMEVEMELFEMKSRNERTALTLSTGGGLGYDVDSAITVAMWGNVPATIDDDGDNDDAGNKNNGNVSGNDNDNGEGNGDLDDGVDSDNNIVIDENDNQASSPSTTKPANKKPTNDDDRRSQNEAKQYLKSFTMLQTWVLSLPDPDHDHMHDNDYDYYGGGTSTTRDVEYQLTSDGSTVLCYDNNNTDNDISDRDETDDTDHSDCNDDTHNDGKNKKEEDEKALDASDGDDSYKHHHGEAETETTMRGTGRRNKKRVHVALTEVLTRARAVAKNNQDFKIKKVTTTETTSDVRNNNSNKIGNQQQPCTNNNNDNGDQHHHRHRHFRKPPPYYHRRHQSDLPPSSRHELLTISFALLVHTYCELLECGLDNIAYCLLSTYRHIHEPMHYEELRDLDKCCTRTNVRSLNDDISTMADYNARGRALRTRIASLRKGGDRIGRRSSGCSEGGGGDSCSASSTNSNNLPNMLVKYTEIKRRIQFFDSKLLRLPFLWRVRALRWQICLSAVSFGALATYLRRDDLLPAGSLLLGRCHVVVEQRDPLPYIPACVFEEETKWRDGGLMIGSGIGETLFGSGHNDDHNCDEVLPREDEERSNDYDDSNYVEEDVRWAAPIHPLSRAAEAGEDVSDSKTRQSIVKRTETLPFPTYVPAALKGKKIIDNNSTKVVENEKERLRFNRSLLINGFRRLAALQVKREYDLGMRGCVVEEGGVEEEQNNSDRDNNDTVGERNNNIEEFGNPMEPSVFLSTLCASSPTTSDAIQQCDFDCDEVRNDTGKSAGSKVCILEEAGIDITCAKICPPDGRRVAAGCDDAAVRIWSIDSTGSANDVCGWDGDNSNGKGTIDHIVNAKSYRATPTSSIVLLGHGNGLPVYNLDWNPDERTLLSAGGDGTLRLWDTLAVGPFGRLAGVVRRSSISSHSGGIKGGRGAALPISGGSNANILPPSKASHTNVPGSQPEPMVEKNGAALASYSGHAESTPVWSCAFAPSGYYFASAGSDATARIWATDRVVPVRILAGHLSPNVNSVAWHPNCNYVLTGSDDRTVRMWDVHTGRSVRILDGCTRGVGLVRVCPSGRYAAGADYGGTVHVWDLGSGRKVNELGSPSNSTTRKHRINSSAGNKKPIIHGMGYSACGTALATGGDDFAIRIWDVRGLGAHESDPGYASAQGFGRGGIGSRGLGFGTSSQLAMGVQAASRVRTPVKTLQTRRTMVLDLNYTKRNLLLSVGKYISSDPIGVTRCKERHS